MLQGGYFDYRLQSRWFRFLQIRSVDGGGVPLPQVMDSFRNLINSPDYLDRHLPAGQTIATVAEKLATLLRDRDGSREVAKEYVRYLNGLPPRDLFRALRLIATDKVAMRDHDGQVVPSSTLFHHSVFFNGDLVYASPLLEGNHEGEGLTTYWVKRKVQEALKKIPKIDLSGVTTPVDNGHPGMPVCDPCVTGILQTDPRCPACRVPVKRSDFVLFQPGGE